MRTKIYTDAEFEVEANRRGYLIRHRSEARQNVQWHHLSPAPDDFEAQAVEELRKQITKDHIQIETRELSDGKTVRSALLRLF